jgi:hypothetical protein
VLNGDAAEWAPPVPDDRVRVERSTATGVGAVKRAACALARGDVLVELDHDDVLTSDCLAEVCAEFGRHPKAALVFSDFAQAGEDLSRNDDRFAESAGWVYSDECIDGVMYQRCHAMAPSPHNVGYIWYAPNHVRAFRREAYDTAGGYDETLSVLDDQELMHRLYEVGEFRHIDRCLYLQRVHKANTQVDPEINPFIQTQTVRFYQQSIRSLATAWAEREGYAIVRLETETSVPDPRPTVATTVVLDASRPAIPFEEGRVGVIEANDILQRIPDRAAFFNECHRVLVHGGLVFTQTPSTDGRGAFQDPSHVAFYNENSFWYLTQAHLRPAVPGLVARLQVSHLRTYFPTPWHEETNIPYVEANLLAIKDGPRQGGPLLA